MLLRIACDEDDPCDGTAEACEPAWDSCFRGVTDASLFLLGIRESMAPNARARKKGSKEKKGTFYFFALENVECSPGMWF